LLVAFLKADDPSAREAALRVLLEEEAAPIIQRVLFRKRSATGEIEDVASAIREQLIRQLAALRGGERESPIRDFRGYVAGVSYSAWADHLRKRHPQRSMLLNRVRYLLESGGPGRRFALWLGEAGENLCGLIDWKTQGRAAPSPKLQWLCVDPRAAAAAAFGSRALGREDVAWAVPKLFTWLAAPIELSDLVSVLGEILELRDDALADPTSASLELASSSASPHEEAVWKEYLLWLWGKLESLTARQSAAFLFGSSVLREFELLGVASIRSLAPRFAMAPEHLATLWQQLPLNDLAIATELDCSRQQVINLRRVARDTLGREWQEFRAQSAKPSNKPPPFTPSIR
jgi:hypothetical protein